jgi:peptidoglycan/xylan/chitin deacetylase (PgdA/CDA1 family)
MKHYYGTLFPLLFPSLKWKVRTKSKTIYLTFDDGPIPEVTEWVLELLKKEEIKATFFCVGDNINKYPLVYQSVLGNGHRTGNHTFNHLNGRKVEQNVYFENIEKCNNYLVERDQKRLYRPPYGKLSFRQIRKLTKEYTVVMWDVLSGDFSPTLSPELCLANTLKYTSRGSIIVFHDNVKSFETLKYVLPKYIKEMKLRGYSFDVL